MFPVDVQVVMEMKMRRTAECAPFGEHAANDTMYYTRN